MKQIKDFSVSSISDIEKDYFIFQRVNDGVTYKIAHKDIIKNCIKYDDVDFVQSLNWSKVTNRPQIACSVSGKATGVGTMDLNSTTPALTISITALDLSSVSLGFTPVTQLGATKVSLEWSSATNSLILTTGSGASSNTVGSVAMTNDLVWNKISGKPILSFSFNGMIAGAGTLDLTATNGVSINITDVTMKPVEWDMILNKPKLRISVANGGQSQIFDLATIGDSTESIMSLNVFHPQMNTITFGNRTEAVSLLMLSSPSIDGLNPTTYDFGIIRIAGNDNKAIIANTAGGCDARGFSSPHWASWDPNDPLNPNSLSYLNRVELYPLLFTPYIIATKQKVVNIVTDTIDIKNALYYNGTYIDLAALADIVNAYLSSQ